MIQPKTNIQIEKSDTPSAKFSLKTENLVHVFKILRDNLYSDKILAVIREYSTNAYDANVENGKKDEPISVTLPNHIEPVFKVRDFGKGLSMDDVFNVYSSYGESTKRETNELVGTLGMGSKSGFAYQNSFTITSWHGGMKSVYVAYIDESEIGTISLFSQEESDEPTGICVSIEVNQKDINIFVNTAVNFYKWFEPLPVFFGSSAVTDAVSNRRSNLIVEGKGYKIFTDTYGHDFKAKLSVMMGNVMYAVADHHRIPNWWLNEYAHYLVLDVPLGSVSFTTSRESIEMNESTIAYLNSAVENVRSELAKGFQQDFDALPTMWDAICAIPDIRALQKIVMTTNGYFCWNGQKVPSDFMRHIAKKWNDLGSWKKYHKNQWDKNTYSTTFIINNGGYPNGQKRLRMNAVHKKYYNKGLVLFLDMNYEESQDWIAKHSHIGFNYVLMSDVTGFDVPVRKRNNGANHKTKQKVFRWNGSQNFPYSNCWESVDQPEGIKYYVHLDAFVPIFNNEKGWRMMNEFVKILKNIKFLSEGLPGLDMPKIEVYGVKKGAVLDDSWLPLEDMLKGVIKFTESNEFIENVAKSKIDYYAIRAWSGYSDVIKNNIRCAVTKKCFKFVDEIGSYSLSMVKVYEALKYQRQFKDVNEKITKRTTELNAELNRLSAEVRNQSYFGKSFDVMWGIAKTDPNLFVEIYNALADSREANSKKVCVNSL